MDNISKYLEEEIVLAKNNNRSFDFDTVIKEIIRKQVEEGVNNVLQAELSEQLGFEKNEQGKAKESGNSRNGSYNRTLNTGFGPILINMPRDRNADFQSAIVKKGQRKTDNIAQLVIKLYSCNMSDSEISEIVDALCNHKYSASTISSMTDAIKEDVEAFKIRELKKSYFAIFIDSTYIPIRRETVDKEGLNLILGITSEGEREVIGYSITSSESATEWEDILTSLRKRGIEDVKVFVTDGLAGLDEVIARTFPKAKRQRCYVHLLRNLVQKVRIEDQKQISKDFMEMSKCKNFEEALGKYKVFIGTWGNKYKSIDTWAQAISTKNIFAFYSFPENQRKYIYTNNAIEGFNKQIKRLLKKRIQFITQDALEKVLVSIFLHYNMKPGKHSIKEVKYIEE